MFARLEKILTKEKFVKIKNLNILLIGIGGVGGYTLEALVRMGVENITIVDYDVIDITNLNRQIITTNENIGNSKVLEAKKRALSINPNINITTIDENINKDNYLSLFKTHYDFVIDACDTITTKLLLIEYCIQNRVKIVSCMGTGNRLNPTKLEITNIWETSNDPLAKVIRKELKKRKIDKKIPVVASREVPRKTNDRTLGSSALVPSVAGIYLANFVVDVSLKNKC